ncbi:MAG TPA: hypothetical protein DCS63_05760 [Elusimicrobia bacterium]|nr:hypothetical protein [Elusimicrobiota bacterium]
MKEEEKEKELAALLAVRRPEDFWLRQKNAIISAASEKRAPARAWLLMPVAAAAALMLVFLARTPVRVPGPETLISTAFLDHLDLLDDMDVLEAVPENEL